jgi:2-dehydropantoate 2-reductase
MEKKERICIIGPGAIGGITAGVLAHKGYGIRLVSKSPELAQKISRDGIMISGICGNHTVRIPSVATPGELDEIFDYVLIATKADALEYAARGILPFLEEHSRVVSMQNGICEDRLAGVVGAERTVGCVVGWGGTLHEPGRVEMTSRGEFILGNWGREPDDALEKLAHILSHVAPARTSGYILPELYSKLIINSCITTLGAICGLYLGEMLSMRKARHLFIDVIREAVAVGDAMGIRIPPGASGKLDYYTFLSTGPLSGVKRHLLLRVIGMKYRRLKSSSLQSLERGRKTEVDNYNGYIAARGRELGVPTSVNASLTALVREIEAGTRPITPENFLEV